MLNKTNLSHISLGVKIFLAMRLAIKTGIAQYVYNKKGEPFLRVSYSRNQPNAFTFFDNAQKNVTQIVLNSLRVTA